MDLANKNRSKLLVKLLLKLLLLLLLELKSLVVLLSHINKYIYVKDVVLIIPEKFPMT